MTDKKRTVAIVIASLLGCVALVYLGGTLSQLLTNYSLWLESDGIGGQTVMQPVNWNPVACFSMAFTVNGLKGMFGILVAGAAIIAYVKLHDRFDSKQYDPRGFTKSKSGIYGTASWMTEKEMREILEISSIEKAEGTILGEYKGKAVCMPTNTRLNRHIAVFGASGTMKSRAIIRNALFQALKRGESVIITDSKGEMYADTSEMYRKAGYDVKIFNLVSPEHGDSWNCMSDLNGDTLMAQVLTNVIIGNTSSGKGDHFWDNGEGNLLKALILLVDQDKSRSQDMKHLSAVYQMLTQNSERQLTAIFEKLPMDHPARAPYNLFAQSSDTVKSGIILGLGTRLQVLQNQAVQKITSRSDIDLSAPGKRKCAYYIVLSDNETSMAFLSSLFFSFLFIKLTRYADAQPEGRCTVPVNLILDEFNNVGRIGGAPDGSDFARTLSVVRSRDIRVMLAVQSLGQLQNRYANNLWSEIIGNCDIQLMLGCTDDVRGTWYLREIKQPDGYVLCADIFPVEISENEQVVEVEITNKRIRGNLSLTKIDEDYPDHKLSGAEFEVYRDLNGNQKLDKEDELLGLMTEVSAGFYEMKDIEFGGALIREKTAPEGFYLDENVYYISIEQDGETYEVENKAGVGFINQVHRGNLKIVKTSSDGTVKGFTFRITGEDYDRTFTTGSDGIILIEDLRVGKYTVTELEDEMSANYKRPDPVTVELVTGETLTVTVHNEKVTVDVPKTGDESNMWIWVGLLGLSIAGAGTLIFVQDKKSRKISKK